METFTFNPDYDAKKKHSPQLVESDFGDGYVQSRPKGLNHNLRTYNLTFSGSRAKIEQIDAFLVKHAGYKAFLWTPPFGSQGKFKCKEHEVSFQQGYGQISCEFTETIA